MDEATADRQLCRLLNYLASWSTMSAHFPDDGGTADDRTPAPGAERIDPEVERLVDSMLPFSRDNCTGIQFDMHGTQFEIVGDLGWYAVYRRRDHSESACWLISWEDLAKDIASREITVRVS